MSIRERLNARRQSYNSLDDNNFKRTILRISIVIISSVIITDCLILWLLWR